MSGPIIGLTAYDPIATWGAWNAPAALIPTSYLEAVLDAGGVPVVLPVGSDPHALLTRIDGLILIGGPDVDPAEYGAERHEATQPPRNERDSFESLLAIGAQARGIPLLAICRGVQLLNVTRGGSLIQHLPDVLGSSRHAPAPGQFGDVTVEVDEGSALSAILGAGRHVVQCSHHQSIDRLGSELVVVARSEDGVIEGVEDPSRPFVLGVQWHPEAGSDRRLFAAIVDAC